MVVVRIVVAAPSCPPPPLFSLLPLFGPCLWARRGWGGVWLAVPSLLAPFLVFGAGGPPSLVAVLAVWGGLGAGVGGVGVVSAH